MSKIIIIIIIIIREIRESEKRNQYLVLVRDLKKIWNMKVTDANYNWHAQYSHQRIGLGTGGLGNSTTGGLGNRTALLTSARILRSVLET